MNLVIVTVVKDDLDGLKETEKSFVEQSVGVDWVIVAPRSQLPTWEYANALVSKNIAKKILVDQGGGVYAAMNFAIQNLELDDWLWFINAGDKFCDPTSVQIVREFLSETDNKWAFGGHYLGSDQGRILGKIPAPYRFVAANQLFAKKYVSHQAVIFKNEFLRNLHGFDQNYKIAADWDLLVRASKQDPGMRIPLELSVFYMGGISTLARQAGNRELFLLRRQHLKNKYFIKNYIWFFYRYFRNLIVLWLEKWSPEIANSIRSLRMN